MTLVPEIRAVNSTVDTTTMIDAAKSAAVCVLETEDDVGSGRSTDDSASLPGEYGPPASSESDGFGSSQSVSDTSSDKGRDELDLGNPAKHKTKTPRPDFPRLPKATYQPDLNDDTEFRQFQLDAPCDKTNIEASILAAWAILLSRYTSLAAEVVVGTRRGAFKLATPPQASVLDLLAAVADLQARTGVIDYTNPEYEDGANTAVVFVPDSKPLPGLDPALVFVADITAQDEFQLCARFDRGVISGQQAIHLVNQVGYVAIQLQMGAVKKLSVSEVSLCCPEDIAQITKWVPAIPSVQRSCLHDMVSHAGKQHPDATAIDAWDGEMSFALLEDQSDRLAYHLVRAGIKPGSHLPLALTRSRLVPIVQLAVLKAGAAYVGIDPAQPTNRLQKIVDAAEAQAIISSPEWSSKVESCGTNVIEVSLDVLETLPSADLSVLPSVRFTDTAVVIFTSGSTGTPKGIVIRHCDFATAIVAHSEAMDFKAGTRVLQFSSFTFDHSMYEIITTLICGGIVCIPNEDDRLSNLTGVLQKMRVQFLYATPTVAKLLDPNDLPDFETIYLGGEAISQSLLDEWLAKKRVISGYGPTEAGMCGFGQFVRGDNSATIRGAIGGAMWVVDPYDYNKLAAIGTVGEVLVEGPMVAAGYLNDAVKTAEGFVASPFWRDSFLQPDDVDSRRFYRTGDFAQYNADGSLHFVGRIDTQVKVNGVRVELGDVEDELALALPPTMQSCAEVVMLSNSHGTASLAAFISFAEESALATEHDQLISSVEDVDRHATLLPQLEVKLRARLPASMVPSIYIPLGSRFPLTSSGKLDRKRLRNLASTLAIQDLLNLQNVEISPLTTDWEHKVRDLWIRVLSIENGEVLHGNSHFFSFGGDSIKAMRLASAARRQDISLNVADILQNPLLSQMASAASPAQSLSSCDVQPFGLLQDDAEDLSIVAAKSCSVEEASIEDVTYCTPLQEGLFALSIRDQGMYVLQKTYPLSQAIEVDKFTQAWTAVANEGGSCLRTRIYKGKQSQMLQTIVREGLEWQYLDTSLDDYLDQDSSIPVTLGSRLSRFAIVNDPINGRFFVLTIHHAIHDAWSLDLLLKDVAAVYEGGRARKRPNFSRFLSYVSHLDQEATGKKWKDQLDGAVSAGFPEVPFGHVPKPTAVLTHTFSIPHGKFDVTLHSDSIKARAAWALLLSSYVGSDNVVFAGVSNGRGAPVPEIEDIIAPTISTIPLSVRIDKNATMQEWLNTMQAQASELIAIEQFGLQNIQVLSEDARNTCAVQNLLLVEVVQDKLLPSKLSFDELIPAKPTAFHSFAFGMRCEFSKSKVSLMANWDPELLSHEGVERILLQYHHILEQIFTADLSKPISALRLMSSSDLSDIMHWNMTAPTASGSCLHSLFMAQSIDSPYVIAVTANDGEMTYQELDIASTKLAARILQQGNVFSPGDLVVLSFEKSIWTIVAILAVLKAGGATVILETTLPEQRREKMMVQVAPRMVLCSSKQHDLFHGRTGVETIQVNQVLLDGMADSDNAKLPNCSPSNTAYVTFTSGSTGEPKGVVISHEAACSSVSSIHEALAMDTQSRLMQFASYAFDAFYGEVFCTLLAGGCLCVISEDDRENRVAGFMQDQQVNCVFLTPTVAAQLDPNTVPTLRWLAVGGERMTESCVEVWAEVTNLINVFGPSEATIMCSAKAAFTKADSLSNIGHPLGCRLWIVEKDDFNLLTPIGVVGEILVEGTKLASGYLNDVSKTAVAFVSDPEWSITEPLSQHFKDVPKRLYRTGDMARYNTDGTLEIMGREDTQLKVRGMRVEVGEIEAHIRKLLPDFDLAVEGIFLEEQPQSALLVAFVACSSQNVAQGGAATTMTPDEVDEELMTTISGIENALSSTLPSYMIPSVFLPVTHVPSTATSKTDRKALRQIAATMSRDEMLSFNSIQTGTQAPTTEAEKRLHALWIEALRRPGDQISVDDNFFRAGGDSIIAMKLVGSARTAGLELKMQDIFQHPTLRDMAKVVGELDSSTDTQLKPFELLQVLDQSVEAVLEQAETACQIPRDQIEDVYPCTPLQSALMALSSKNPGTYMGQITVLITKEMDVERWCHNWEVICRRSPILRTRFFHTEAGDLMQAVYKPSVAWQQGVGLSNYLDRDKTHLMEVGQALCRSAIVSDGGDTYFVLSLHRSTYDAWSLIRLFEDMEKIYLDENISLGEVTGFNVFSNSFLRMDMAACESFWTSQMADAPIMSYPRLPELGYQPSASSHHRVTMKIGTDRSEFTSATIIRVAWSLLLARYADDTEDVVFGASLNGRSANVRGLGSIVGPTTAVVPVRVKFDKKAFTVADLLAQVQNQATTMMEFEQYGIYNISQLSPHVKQACDFQTLLMIQTASESSMASTGGALGLQIRDEESGAFHTFSMSLDAVIDIESIAFTVEYDAKVLMPTEVERLSAQFEQILLQLHNPSNLTTKLADLDLMTSTDMEQLATWNPTPPALQEVSVHSLFEKKAREYPGYPAVCSWEGELTYQELNTMSSTLARQLQDRGLEPKTLVPLIFEKSIYTVVTMMAVLKAGCACVTLDPAHPVERLRGLISDVGGDLVICSGQWSSKAATLSGNLLVVDSDLLSDLRHNQAEMLTASHQPSPLDPAFILFTSGSTGKPKAIIISHSSFVSSICGHAEVLRYGGPGSRNLQFTAYTSDVSIGEIFTSLAVGACVCVPSDAERMDGIAIAMERMRVNWAFLTPSVASLVNPKDVPSLRTLLFGGETATPHNVATWAPAVYLINSFGPAECSIWTHCHPGIDTTASGHNIGFGIGCNTWIVDADDHNKLVPIGTIGELIVEGPNVADGYLNNQEKTEAAFINEPAWLPNNRPTSKLYKMGDLVRYLPNGQVHYVGRRDTQVKLRGQRIELGEIEHQLRLCMPDITEVAVEMVRPANGTAPPTLVAFLGASATEQYGKESGDSLPEIATCKEDLERYTSAVTGIRETLANVLPRHMIPSAYLPLVLMPFTASAKTDRGRLQKLARAFSVEELSKFSCSSNRVVIAPTTALEKSLQSLWVKLLNIPIENIGRDEDFFLLGGDSILAMRLVALARQQRLELTVEAIFKNPTLTAMSLAAKSSQKSDSAIAPFDLISDVSSLRRAVAKSCRLNEDDVEDIYPATPLQEGLLALAQREKGSYMAQFAFLIPEHIDLDRLRAAWEVTYQQVPILRTRLINTKDGATMQVVTKAKLLWRSGSDKANYLAEDRALGMTMGQPLSRFAIVEDRVLVFSAHHAVYDGWSVQPIYRRVEEIYHGLSTRQPVQYNEFIRYIQSIDRKEAAEFWTKQLEQAPPSVFPRQTLGAEFKDMSLSMKVLFKKKGDLSGMTGATLVRTALALALGRYSELDDVVYGCTQSGRAAPLRDVDEIIGPTLATTPVRIKIPRDAKIRDVLRGVQDQSFELIRYEQLGIQSIQQVSPDAKMACDFKALLVIQNPEGDFNKSHATFLGCSTANADFFKPFHTYPLVMQCTFNPEGYILDLNFDGAAISPAQAQRFLNHFVRLVEQLDGSSADARVEDMVMMTPDDHRDILQFTGDVPAAQETCLHTLCTAKAKLQPQSQAVLAWDGDFSYEQLEKLSSVLAHDLIGEGVSAGDIVPLCFEKSKWAVVAMLAILKSGAAYCPLDPKHPADRTNEILSETSARIVLASSSTAQLFSQFGRQTIEVSTNRIGELQTRYGDQELPQIEVMPDSTAYCLFTSGSTGKPKGVITSHRAIATSVSQHHAFGLHKDMRMLQFSAYTFDISVVEIFSTLAHGGCICMPSDEQRLDGLVDVMNSMAVTIAILTPSFAKSVSPEQVPHLEQLILGAEAVTKTSIQEWVGKVRLMNAYGVTEASVCNMIAEVVSPDFSERCIGSAVGSISWIVDADNHNVLMPVGLVGELAIEGPILSDGYLNDPEKTAQSFIDLPRFMETYPLENCSRSRRIYLTGDLVRYGSNDQIEFVGRKDTQIKLRGLRIELGEIETQVRRVLGGLPGIAAEVVTPSGRVDHPTIALFLHYETSEGAMLVEGCSNVLELTPELSPRITDLHDDLLKVLPSYMIPTLCYSLKSMPMLTSGKIDRKRLRSIAFDHTSKISLQRLSESTEFEAITSEMEIRLRDMWASVLSLDLSTIGKKSSFFRIGGDSLTAVKLVSLARSHNIGLTVAKIFDHPSLAALASVVTTSAEGALIRAPPPFSLIAHTDVSSLISEAATQAMMSSSEIEDLYPATALQEGMMVASLQDVGTYNAHFAYRLSSSLDLHRFRLAWRQVALECQMMRTRIVHTARHGFIQVVSNAEMPIQTINGTDVDSYKASVPFMGLGSPLYVLAILGEDQEDLKADRWLVLTMHHAGYDGWSLTNLWRAVQEEYFDLARSPILGINHLIRYLGQYTEEANTNFWRTYLDGSKPPAFPVLPHVSYRSVADSELTMDLDFVKPTNSDNTTATLLQAAWGLLMSLYEGSDDVTYGLVVSGRTTPVTGIEDMIGSAIANFPFRVQHRSNDTVDEFLDKIRRNATDLIPYQQFGFQNIRKASPDAKEASRLRTLLVFQAAGFESLGLNITNLGITPQPVKVAGLYTFPITATCSLDGEKISVNVSYDSQLLSAELIQRLMHQFEHLIGQLANSPDTRLKDLSLISPSDVAQIHTWQDLDIVKPNEQTIHSMFSAQAKNTPHALAVCSWDGELTYQQLDDYSDRLAERLVELGVGPEIFVGFCFDKSIWSVATMIAIFKAGGVWSPLNSAHPKARLHSLISRIAAPLVLAAPDHAHLFEECSAKNLTVDGDYIQALTPASPGSLQVDVRSGNAAYIMFTSGSTGEPKGVVVEHRNACSGLPAQARVQGKTQNSRYLQFAAFTWDFCVGEMFANLLAGACVCMPSEHDRLNDLAGAIKAMRINQASLTPTVAKLLDPTTTPLKTLSLGGEALTQDLVNAWADHTNLVNVYGPTECTVWCAGRNRLAHGDSPANIGYGLNCSMWIADPENSKRLMPIGTPGEILVDGPVVARGYFKDPKATSRVFLDELDWAVESGKPQRRIYATGDLGVYEKDGSIRVLGRRDMQVKLNGQRVDLGEIDFQLTQALPEGTKLATEVIRLQNRSRPLLAVFVAADSSTSTASRAVLLKDEVDRATLGTVVEGVEKSILAHLPEFMVPRFYIPINCIPVSGNQKIDHKALHALCADLNMEEVSKLAVNPGAGEVREPSTELGLLLRELWAEILGITVSVISAGDSFSALGGDSMGAVRLVSLARSKGFSLTVADILQHQVLDDMTGKMTYSSTADTADVVPYELMRTDHIESLQLMAAEKCGIDVSNIIDIYPATPAQTGFLRISSTRPGVTSLLTAFEMPDHVDAQKLEAAWKHLVRSYSMLRTRVVQLDDGRWIQIVEKENTAPLKSAASIHEYYLQETAEPLGVGTPLTRAGFVSDESTGKRYFCTNACHSTYDAWAYALLFASLEKAYLSDQAEILEVPHKRFVRYLENRYLETSDAFWIDQYQGYTPPPLLGEVAGKTVESNTICDLEVHLPLDKLRPNVSMPTAIYASWALALCQLTGASDVTILLTLSGRNAPVADIEQIMGPILTTVPLRVKVDPLNSAQWFLLNLESQCRSMIPHEQCSLDRIRTLSPGAQAAVDQSFGLTVNPYNHHKAGLGSGMGLVRPLRIPMAQSPSPFFLDCAITDYGVDGFGLFDDRIVERARVRRYFAHFEHNLRTFLLGSGEELIKDFALDEKLLADDGQKLNMVPVGPGLGYDPVSKSTIDIEKAFSKGGALEKGFSARDEEVSTGAIKSEHAQYLR